LKEEEEEEEDDDDDDILFEKLIVTQLVRQPAFFMEPRVSLPCSQKSATGSYPEPAKSSSSHRSLSL
jgi:hypothetical protein